MSNGCPVHVSFCLTCASPRLSYLCVHFPGPAAGSAVGLLTGPPTGTPAVRCVLQPPRVISTYADLALLRVPIPGASDVHREFDYFVYTAHPYHLQQLDLLPKPLSRFRDCDAAILRCPRRGYVIACLKPTIKSDGLFNFQLYDSSTRRWSTSLLRLDSSSSGIRDAVLPIPNTASELVFHDTTKVITLDDGTVGWVDLWRGILFCNVLDEMPPVLRDMPLPKPARRNKRDFCIGCPHYMRDITVAHHQNGSKVIKYVEMETRPGDVPQSPSRRRSSSESSQEGSSSDSDDDEPVAYYWKANIWTMPAPISSSSQWKDWHRDCTLDVTDIVIDEPRHSELLLPLPRHSADPEDAKWSLRRMITAHPTLGLGINGENDISFLSEVDVKGDDRAWVIAVNMTSKKLTGVAQLNARKNSFSNLRYVPSEISKFLAKATGEEGTLVKTSTSSRKSRGRGSRNIM